MPARSDPASVEAQDLARLVAEVARTLADSLRFRTVAISLFRPAWDDFVVVGVHGTDGARGALLGRAVARDDWAALLDERYQRRGAYFVPADAEVWALLGERFPRHFAELDATDDPGAWQAGDVLLVPFDRRDGGPLGIVVVAEPASGRRPAARDVAGLVARTALTGRVVESRLAEEHDDRHRRALEHLIRISAELLRGDSTEQVLNLVCAGVAEALGFGHVIIELADREADRYRPAAAAGIDLTAMNVQLDVPIETLDRFFDPEFETVGCYLADRERALARVGEEPASFRSSTNGRGPYAWNRHWLLVPLHNGSGERIGFIWADDPADHLLPSPEKLQALRLFADQAATALEVAAANEAARQKAAERERAEAALRKTQELHRRVIETSTDLIALFDLKGRILFVSPASRTILGYEPAELVGRRLADLVHPDDLDSTAEVIRAALAGQGSRPNTARVRHRAGHWISLEGVPAPIDDDAGEPEMILGVARDVSERIAAEEERRSLEDQLRQAHRMEAVGRLAGGVAHDFNNLLTAIGGYGQLALDSLAGDEPRVRRQLEELLRAADRAAALTRQLLTFSRRQLVRPRVLDVNVVVRDVESLLTRLIGADVELVTALDPDLGRTEADPSQLEQVVVNLAVNARDAMRDGGRLLIETANADLDEEFVSRHVGSRPGAYVSLTVADTGEGMDAETVVHAFEPFFTTKGPGEGTGLGLSTVYGIVKQSNGYVAVDSQRGRGTVVTVYLPRVPALAEPEPATAAKPVAPATRGGRETVLVVEDEEIVRSLVHEMLTGFGYTVLEARDGEEALALLSGPSAAVDLVITDLVMPRMSGRELASRVSEVSPHTAVLLVSGYAGDTTAPDALAPGSAFLEKPFTAPELAEKVRSLLDARGRPARSAA